MMPNRAGSSGAMVSTQAPASTTALVNATRCGPAPRRPPSACARSLLFGADQGGGAVPLVPRKLLSHDPSGSPPWSTIASTAPRGPCATRASPGVHGLRHGDGARSRARALGRRQPGGERDADLVALPLAGGGDLAHVERRAAARARAAVALQRRRGHHLGPVQRFPKAAKRRVRQPVDDARARAVLATPWASSPRSSTWVSADTGAPGEARGGAGRHGHDGAAAGLRPEGASRGPLHPELHAVRRPRRRARHRPRRVRALPARHVLPPAQQLGRRAGATAGTRGSTRRRCAGGSRSRSSRWTPSRSSAGRQPPACPARRRRRATGSRPRQHPRHLRAAVPRHSPRHDGVCAVAGQCAGGLRQPDRGLRARRADASGKDPDTGITWTCGPGGCATRSRATSDPGAPGLLPCVVPGAGLHPGEDGRRAGVRGVMSWAGVGGDPGG
jgi:hypothetical protein